MYEGYDVMPPKEKIPEAYTAVIDNRVIVDGNTALVKSSDLKKNYTVIWNDDNLFYSNDNATYWAKYIGYPVIAVLMVIGKLPYSKDIAKYFSKVNWNELNKKNKRDYQKSVEEVIKSVDNKSIIYEEIDRVYKQLESLNIKLTRKKFEV